MDGIKAKKKLQECKVQRGLKKEREKKRREKETGDLNSTEDLNFFCLRGCFF